MHPYVEVSGDGRHIAYTAFEPTEPVTWSLFVRPIDLPGTGDVVFASTFGEASRDRVPVDGSTAPIAVTTSTHRQTLRPRSRPPLVSPSPLRGAGTRGASWAATRPREKKSACDGHTR